MEKSPFGSLFGNTTTTVMAVDEPPPAQLDPFKIPMKIVERVMNNCYSGDGTVHLGDHLLFIHELCELFKCAGITTSEVKRKLFSLSLKGRAAEWYRLLKDGRSIGWEEIVLSFIPSSILQVRFIKIGTKYIIFGLMMERVLPKRGGD
jgi:hypothetical protein